MPSTHIEVYGRKARYRVGVNGIVLDVINNKSINLKTIGVIDSGCTFTSIPYKSIDSDCKEPDLKHYKRLAIQAFREGTIKIIGSRGVESNHSKENKKIVNFSLLSDEELMKKKDISFVHTIKDFKIGGYLVGDIEAKINYDRDHPPLIGMNVLKLLETPRGLSKVDNEDILIGCRHNNKSTEYLLALRKHFGYIPEELLESSEISALIREKWEPRIPNLYV